MGGEKELTLWLARTIKATLITIMARNMKMMRRIRMMMRIIMETMTKMVLCDC